MMTLNCLNDRYATDSDNDRELSMLRCNHTRVGDDARPVQLSSSSSVQLPAAAAAAAAVAATGSGKGKDNAGVSGVPFTSPRDCTKLN